MEDSRKRVLVWVLAFGVVFFFVISAGVYGGFSLKNWNENRVIEILKSSRDKAEKAKRDMEMLSDELIALSSILDTKRERLIRVNRRLEMLNRAMHFFYTSMDAREILSHLAKILKDELKAKKVEAEVFNIKGDENIKYSPERKAVPLLIRWEILNHYFEMWKREDLIFSLVLLDVDFFKQINDVYGHLVGDKVLRELSNILKSSMRRKDMVFRYGGEEFLILLPGVRKDEALEIVERIRREIHGHTFFSDDGREIRITISAGITSSESAKGLMSVSDMLKVVDNALYEAKPRKRNLTVIK